MEQNNITYDHNTSSPLVEFDKWTKLIVDVLPLDINSLIFTGNLLFKSYLNTCGIKRKTKTNQKFKEDELEYIDLYLFGSLENKKETFHKIICNLKQKIKYNTQLGETIQGTIKDNQIKIIIQWCPRIIRIFNIDSTRPSDIISSFPFAHYLMYLSDKGLYLSPFAQFSIKQKKLMPNPITNARANLSQLESIFEYNLNPFEYIIDFYTIKNSTEDDNEFKAYKTFYAKYLKHYDHVFVFIDSHQLKEIKLDNNNEIDKYLKSSSPIITHKENFLEENYQITNLTNFNSLGTLLTNNLSKTIFYACAHEVFKFVSLSKKNNYYLMSIDNLNSIYKLKKQIEFCVKSIKNSPYYQTCIVKSETLTDEENKLFNTNCTFRNMCDTDKVLKKIAPYKKNNRLYFIAGSNHVIQLEKNIPTVFSIDVKKNNQGCIIYMNVIQEFN